jgi:iron complex outermembrane receptor protein
VNIKRALLMSGACGILATAVSTALAQQTSEVAEVVIVTGSYIRGTAEDAALPVDVITAEDLAKQGSPSALEIIKDLSVSAGVLGDTNQFDARAQGTEGSGSVNLRGFGPQRTLVLLNGRRMVHSPFLFGAVDTNFIPLAAIGRVEVLKDGAAATYGSDAVAGVVNFITKENLRGLDVRADFEQIEDSDGDYSFSGSFGWGNDRSSALFALGYQHRSELFVRDRDWAAKDYLENPQGGWSASGNPHSFIPLGATGTPVAGVTRDPQCAPLGGFAGVTATNAPVCYWQYSVYDALTEEEDRWQVYADYNLDITESTSVCVCNSGPTSISRLSACDPSPCGVLASFSCSLQRTGTERQNAIIRRTTAIFFSSRLLASPLSAAARRSNAVTMRLPFSARIETVLVVNN